MTQLFANNAATTLASAVASTDTTLTVVDGSRFPSPSGGDYFHLTLTSGNPETAWEIAKVTGRIANVLTVVRAQDGTTAQGWATGVKAEHRLTAGILSSFLVSASMTPNALINGATAAPGSTGVVAIPLGNAPGAGVPGVVQLYAAYAPVNAVPIMTNYTTPSGVASASGDDPADTAYAWSAFTPSSSYGWIALSAPPVWLQYQFASVQVVNGYQMSTRNITGYPARSPVSWVLRGSNDGTTWTDLDAQTISSGLWVADSLLAFSFTNTTAYLYYRIYITANAGAVAVTEIRRFMLMRDGDPILLVRVPDGTIKTVTLT